MKNDPPPLAQWKIVIVEGRTRAPKEKKDLFYYLPFALPWPLIWCWESSNYQYSISRDWRKTPLWLLGRSWEWKARPPIASSLRWGRWQLQLFQRNPWKHRHQSITSSLQIFLPLMKPIHQGISIHWRGVVEVIGSTEKGENFFWRICNTTGQWFLVKSGKKWVCYIESAEN